MQQDGKPQRDKKPSNMRGLFLRELKNGKTVIDVILFHNKKRVCLGGFPSVAQAREMYKKAKALQMVGQFDPRQYQKRGRDPKKLDGPLTFLQYADRFLHERKVAMPHASWLDIKRLTHGMWKHTFGSVPLIVLSREHIKEWIAQMLEEEEEREEFRKPQTRLAMLTHLRHVLRAARADGFLTSDPTFELDELCGDPIPFVVIPLSAEEERQFLAGVQQHALTWYPFWFLLLRTGMRLGEALALKPEDLDFSKRKIWVRRTWTGEGSIQEYTKTKKPRRIDMANTLKAALERHLAKIQEDAALAWEDAPIYLFQGLKELPYSHAHVRESIFRPLLEKLKLRRFRIHDLRHTVACNMLERGDRRGVTLKAIQRLLGHTTIKTTCDIYLNYIPDEEEFAVDALDEVDNSFAICPACRRPYGTTGTATHSE